MSAQGMIVFPLSGETCRHLTSPRVAVAPHIDPGVCIEVVSPSEPGEWFPIPPHVCRQLHGSGRSQPARPCARRTGRARSSWPVRWGKTWLNGCADFSGPRQGGVDELMVACYPFVGSPVVTAGGTIGAINAGSNPEELVRLYRFCWDKDRLRYYDYGGGTWVFPSPVSNAALIGLGDQMFFGPTTQGVLQAQPTNKDAVLLDHPEGTPYAVASDLQSLVFLEVEEIAVSLHWYRVEDQALRHDACRRAFRAPVSWNSDRALCASPGGVMVASTSPAAWDVYFALEPRHGERTTCELLTATLEHDHGLTKVAVVQRAIHRVEPSPDPLANLHLLADANGGVSVWESAVPPVVLPNGQVAVLRGRTLWVTSAELGASNPACAIDLPGDLFGAVAGMVADADGWLYVAAGSALVAIDRALKIAWTVDCGDQITGEPVPVAPASLVVTASRRFLRIE